MLIVYSPVIWRMRDWDSYHVIDLLQYGLSRLRKNIYDNNRHMNCKISAKQIRIVEILLQRIQDDKYDEVNMKHHDEKWGKLVCAHVPTKDPDITEWRTVRREIRDDKTKKQESKEFMRIYKHSEQQRKYDMEYALLIIKKYWQQWWD